jgi:hypothetical protein
MTVTSLVRSRDYLAGQRRAIIARSVAGSLTSALPIPFLDDWMMGLIVGSGYRRIAAAHHIDLDDDARKTLVHGSSPPPNILDLAVTSIMLRVAGSAARRMLVALATINRARSAARTFVTMTLFDHYCAKLHVGLALDGVTALALREAIGPDCDVVLLGSVASGKYVDLLLPIFGDRLLFPPSFVGRGDMSRGGLMLRCVMAGFELPYEPLSGAIRHGQRPPRLEPLRARRTSATTKEAKPTKPK